MDSPRPDEVLVRIVATGMCHSDLIVADQVYPLPLPWVLGHEGAGVVEEVGATVKHVSPGDHVLLTFDSCGHCAPCEENHPAYCRHFGALNMSGCRSDGTSTLVDQTDVSTCFFYQSSFATHALAHGRNVVKVAKDAPLELLGPLGCGIQTGAGAILNVLKPRPDANICIIGAGAVGLSALMAARILGCCSVLVADRMENRLRLAEDLGASQTINTRHQDLDECLQAAGGMDFVIEATGVSELVPVGMTALRDQGTCAIVGAYPPAHTVPIDFSMMGGGRSIRHIVEGDADPQVFIPQLVAYVMSGRLPLEKIVKFYPFADIETARQDSARGDVIKPIIRVSTLKST